VFVPFPWKICACKRRGVSSFAAITFQKTHTSKLLKPQKTGHRKTPHGKKENPFLSDLRVLSLVFWII
jgi:hypothetical protein